MFFNIIELNDFYQCTQLIKKVNFSFPFHFLLFLISCHSKKFQCKFTACRSISISKNIASFCKFDPAQLKLLFEQFQLVVLIYGIGALFYDLFFDCHFPLQEKRARFILVQQQLGHQRCIIVCGQYLILQCVIIFWCFHRKWNSGFMAILELYFVYRIGSLCFCPTMVSPAVYHR